VTEVERALRERLHHSAETFDPLDGAAVRAAAQQRDRRGVHRFVVPAVVAASVAGIAVAGALIAQQPSPSAGPAGSAAPAGPRPSSIGGRSTAADHAFQVRLVLPARSFPANGQPIHAYVLAINHTGRPVVIHDACNGWVQAGLTGGHVTFGIFSGQVGCASKTINPGTTRVPVIILTTFTQCQQGKQPGTPDTPHCVGPNSSPPNLPAGNYRAEVGTQSTSVQPLLSKPQPVTLTANR
jgi:hypothetical protein